MSEKTSSAGAPVGHCQLGLVLAELPHAQLSRTGMGLEGFPHGILSALEFLNDDAVAHQLSVQAQIPKQVKHCGDRDVPIRLRVGGAPLVTLGAAAGSAAVPSEAGSPTAAHRAYPVVDPASDEHVMLVKTLPTDPPQVVARDKWHFTESDTVALDGGFEPGRIYDVVYLSEGPRVVGTGLAGTRDLVSFFKYDESADNPLPGIDYALGWGVVANRPISPPFPLSGVQRGRIGPTGLRRGIRSGGRRRPWVVQPSVRPGLA